MCYFKYDVNGLNPKQCYYAYESYGKKICNFVTCNDPIMVQRIIWGKQLTNMTIKMWSEDIRNNLLYEKEIEPILMTMPKWCEKSLKNSLK